MALLKLVENPLTYITQLIKYKGDFLLSTELHIKGLLNFWPPHKLLLLSLFNNFAPLFYKHLTKGQPQPYRRLQSFSKAFYALPAAISELMTWFESHSYILAIILTMSHIQELKCVCFVLSLCNKLPNALQFKVFISSQNFCGSGIWEWFSLVALAQGRSKSLVFGQGFSYLKGTENLFPAQ